MADAVLTKDSRGRAGQKKKKRMENDRSGGMFFVGGMET